MAQMKFYLDLEDKIVEKYFQLDLEHELWMFYGFLP